MAQPQWALSAFGALLAVSLLVLASCPSKVNPGPTPTAVVKAPAVPSSPTPESPSPTPAIAITPHPALSARPFPADSAADVRTLFERTAQLRGLQSKVDVPYFLINRGDAATYLVSSLEPDDRAVILLHQEVYRLLGLIPDNADLIDLQITLLRGAVLGFYDPDVRQLFILDDLGLSSPVTRLTLVHEFTHALQDQYYDLNRVEAGLRDDWDAEAAWIDLLEGDARSSETTFLSPNLNIALSRFCNDASFDVNPNSSIPAVIQRELNTPYTDGLCFVRSVKDRLPEGVDSAHKRLPTTTEQILHPEKYLEGEGAKRVDLPSVTAALGPGWRQTASSNLGEFTLQNLLLLGISNTDTVKRAAAGWGGDRWALYASGDNRLIEVAIAWDSAPEAREFWSAFLASLNTRSGGRLRPDANATTVVWEQGSKSLRGAISGDTVTFVMSTDAAAVRAAAGVLGLP